MMENIADLFYHNMGLVFFVSGLSWFIMGLAADLVARQGLGLKLAKSLPWLAAFGITHALVEWGDMLKLAAGPSSALSSSEFLPPVLTILLGLSAAFLLQFGAHLLANTDQRLRWLLAVPPMLFVVWIISPLFVPQFLSAGGVYVPSNTETCLYCHTTMPTGVAPAATTAGESWLHVAEVWARYLLYLPGLALAALGLWKQAPTFKAMNLNQTARDVKLAAVVLGANILFAGLVVAPAPYFPASILNYHTFATLFQLPPQVFRAVLALLTAFFIVRTLRVFEREHRRQLEEARLERQRVQELYLKGLEERVVERTRYLATLAESAKTLASTLDLDELLTTVMNEISSMAGSTEAGILFLHDESDSSLKGRSSFGCSEEAVAQLCLVPGEVLGGQVFQKGRAFVSQDEREIAAAMSKLSFDNLQWLDAARSGLSRPHNVICLPLRVKDRYIGSLLLANSGAMYAVPMSILEALADHIALAVDNAHLYEQTKQLAATDPMTGLWNRRVIVHRAQTEIDRCKRKDQEVSILVVDIDELKLFNDTYGHKGGDEVINIVASVLRNSCRDMDEVGRYGGDEFIVVLPDTNAEGASSVAGRILENLAERRFLAPNGDSVPIAVSIGGATYPHDAPGVDELLSEADAAMYQTKLEGGAGFTSHGSNGKQQGVAPVPTLDALKGLVATVDAKDRYTLRHSQQVTEYVLRMAEALSIRHMKPEVLQLVGQLHDIGKIGIPSDILRKPGRLSAEEYNIIKEHPKLGSTILQQLPEVNEILGAVRHHHERWDGKGYPDGLKGEEIPTLARIVALADAYSAMTTDRPYRKALSQAEALGEIQTHAGTQFDPKLAEVFVRVVMSQTQQGTAIEQAPSEELTASTIKR